MVFLDAFALIALVLDETSADAVDELIATRDCAVTSVNLAETVDVCCRARGLNLSDIDAVLSLLLDGPVRVLAPGAEEGRAAGLIRAAHYDGRARPISLADCFLLAAATPIDAIATEDAAVLAIARELGIETIALP